MNAPERIEAARRTLDAESVTQVVHPVDRERKRELLSHLITAGSWKQVLVFTRTKHGANKLAEQLDKGGITAAAIHGNKSQSARTRALADFKQGRVRVLVATDIAARGIDIDRLPHVVNFELPNVAEDYVHRIGRTGRAGMSGEAVSLVSSEESDLMAGIKRILKRDIPVVPVTGFEARQVSRASSFLNRNERPGRAWAGRAGEFRTGRNSAPGRPSGKGAGAERSWRDGSRRSPGRTSVVTGFE
jgi:ATP-dependent RNA helicase RhlE